jgi:deferrochelatase/peroxidase EfeB
VFGRRRTTGAPLNASREFDKVDLNASDQTGEPLIPVRAHIRLASPDTNAGERLLRRGYSFTDGIDPLTGELDAGLFFICFQRDPRTAFVAVQRQLAQSDTLNEYIRHTGSGVYACPPGVASTDYVGSRLF